MGGGKELASLSSLPKPRQGMQLPSWAKPLGRILKNLGPGLITGASDDDPSGIGTYASAGASLGYACLWTAPLTFPLMAAVQFICAKVGLVTGMGLAGVLRKHYSRWLLYPAVVGLVVANTINAGADLGAIAAGFNLIAPVLPIPWVVIAVTLAILILQIWGSYRFIAAIFKWLTLSLFAYIGASFFARPDWSLVLAGTLVPTFQGGGLFWATLVAILGTTISPYLFFWMASQEVEEKHCPGKKRLWRQHGVLDRELHYAAWDVNVGMLFSNTVMYFIILATAATLFKNGPTTLDSAAQAAEALRPLAGDVSSLLFALGLIGTGFLAVPVLTTSGAYAVAETFNWKFGLDRTLKGAAPFYGVIVGSSVVGLLINFLGITPLAALFWTAVINGFLAPPLLLLIMLISRNKAIMRDQVNGPITTILGWTTMVVMAAAAVGLIITWDYTQ